LAKIKEYLGRNQQKFERRAGEKKIRFKLLKRALALQAN
jgi:hypothetical protein